MMFPLSKLSNAVADDAKMQAPQQMDRLLEFIRLSAWCSVTTVKCLIRKASVALGRSSNSSMMIRMLSRLASSPGRGKRHKGHFTFPK